MQNGRKSWSIFNIGCKNCNMQWFHEGQGGKISPDAVKWWSGKNPSEGRLVGACFLPTSSYPRFSLCVLDSAASLGLFPANIFLSMIFEKEISLRLILRNLGACFIPTSFPCAQFCGTLGLFPANIFLSTIFLALDFAASWSLFPANIFLATGILALLCISIWALVCISSLALVCIFVQHRLVFIPWLWMYFCSAWACISSLTLVCIFVSACLNFGDSRQAWWAWAWASIAGSGQLWPMWAWTDVVPVVVISSV